MRTTAVQANTERMIAYDYQHGAFPETVATGWQDSAHQIIDNTDSRKDLGQRHLNLPVSSWWWAKPPNISSPATIKQLRVAVEYDDSTVDAETASS